MVSFDGNRLIWGDQRRWNKIGNNSVYLFSFLDSSVAIRLDHAENGEIIGDKKEETK